MFEYVLVFKTIFEKYNQKFEITILIIKKLIVNLRLINYILLKSFSITIAFH